MLFGNMVIIRLCIDELSAIYRQAVVDAEGY